MIEPIQDKIKRLLLWSRLSNKDPLGERIFRNHYIEFLAQRKRENAFWVEPELLNGKIHRKYPDYKQEKKKKVGLLKKLSVIIP